MSLSDDILALDDATAERILATVARHRLQPTAGTLTTLTPAQADALAREIGSPPSTTPGTRAELARATLLLLAEDPDRQAELQALVRHPPAEKLGIEPITATLITTAALVALQTYVKIEYDAKAGLRVKIEKPSADTSLLGKIAGLCKGFFSG
jgi:hypothetical protein